MKQAAVGFRAHSGWTALVAISLEDGSPRVLWRQRSQLVKTFTYEFRQPYHAAEKRSPAEAPGIITRARTEARSLAYHAIRSVRTSLQQRGYELRRCGLLLASGRQLLGLPQILASHTLIHTADGELFREALLHGSKRCGLETLSLKESGIFEEASRILHEKPDMLVGRVAELGTALGPPWAQDEKLSALVAWLSLLQKNESAKTNQ
jgi:hypothetical protein